MTEPQTAKRGWFARWRERRRIKRQQALERSHFELERARSNGTYSPPSAGPVAAGWVGLGGGGDGGGGGCDGGC